MRSVLLLLPSAVAAASCGSFNQVAFADMKDGDIKTISLTDDGSLTISQKTPVAWSLTTEINLTTCIASVDFSKSDKPSYPPVPLNAAVLQSTVGTLLLEFTDPSGTLDPAHSVDYPLNQWTTHPEMPAAQRCVTFGEHHFQDLHDGDVKTVSLGADLVLTMGQPGIWNLTTPVDPKTCKATVDFSTSDKPDQPPVPLVASVSIASGNDGKKRVLLTYTDPSSTISSSPDFPLNIWQGVP